MTTTTTTTTPLYFYVVTIVFARSFGLINLCLTTTTMVSCLFVPPKTLPFPKTPKGGFPRGGP